MADKNFYYPLWRKYLPVLAIQMKNTVNGVKTIQMSKMEFDAHGDRPKSSYKFNLEVKEGRVANDINGTAVARDLFEVLKENATIADLLRNYQFKISLGSDFVLKVTRLG